MPPALPQFGALWLDSVFIPFDNATSWTDKKGKKFIYKDQTLKYQVTCSLKSQSLAASLKKLNLVIGTDYRTGMPIRVTINAGAQTFTQSILLDKHGKYKQPK